MPKKTKESDLSINLLKYQRKQKEALLEYINHNNIISLPISENKFYHDIIKINSIKDFFDSGWVRELNNTISEIRIKQSVPYYKHVKAINAGIFGFEKTGKTYILQKISKRIDKNNEEKFEKDYVTESYETYLGLNLHYLIINETKINIFFDTKGIGNIPLITKSKTSEEIANLYYDYFKVNNFIEKFILNNTSTIFYVIGNEKEREKKYYEKIKNECPITSNLIIIHNLYKCNEEQIKERKQKLNEDKQFKEINNDIYLERYEKGSNNIIYLIHVIIYNDNNTKNKEKNNLIFTFIEKQLIFSTKYSKDMYYFKDKDFYKENKDLMYLYLISFKNFLVKNSLEFFGDELKIDDINIEKDKISIKNNYKYEIHHKKRINQFNPEVVKPKYLIKKNNTEHKIIIILELSSYKELKAIVEIKQKYYLIIITGEVKLNIPEKEKIIYNNIEEGPIYLEIKLGYEKCLLEDATPKIENNIIKFKILPSTTNEKQFN